MDLWRNVGPSGAVTVAVAAECFLSGPETVGDAVERSDPGRDRSDGRGVSDPPRLGLVRRLFLPAGQWRLLGDGMDLR